MCGILGYASPTKPVCRHSFLEALKTLEPRGPDHGDVSFLENERVALGHRRLAVVDLNERSHQPMGNAANGTLIVFNGEVYNFRKLRKELTLRGHQFRTESDTEVILACYQQYGVDCVNKFDGMFSLAIYDPNDRSVFLARDQAGQKPLYYLEDGNRLVFASELKALLAYPDLPRSLSKSGLNEYLAYGYVSDEGTILEGYKKLPPGWAARYSLDSGCLNKWQYWSRPHFEVGGSDEDELLDEFQEILTRTIRNQLVADVPLAVTLSGGLDSSIVAAIAAHERNSLNTFTVTFPGQEDFDESVFARQIARHIGSHHTEIEAESPSREILMRIVRAFCEPIADNSIVPTFLVAQAVRGSSTVALGGDGGDELFGGYPHHKRVGRLTSMNRVLSSVFHPFEQLVPEGLKGANTVRAAIGSQATCAYFNRYMSPSTRNSVLRLLTVTRTCWDPSSVVQVHSSSPKSPFCRNLWQQTLAFICRETFFRKWTVLQWQFLWKFERHSLISR